MESEQRRVDVGSEDELYREQPLTGLTQSVESVVVQILQLGTSGRQYLGVTGSECGQHACSPIIGSTATEPDDDPSGAIRQGRLNELPHAVGAGDHGVALAFSEQVEAASLSRLDVCRSAAARFHHQERSRNGAFHRVGDRDGYRLAAESVGQHVQESGSTIGQRHQGELVHRRAAAPALRDRLGRLASSKGSGETVRSNEYPHTPHVGRCHSPAKPRDGAPTSLPNLGTVRMILGQTLGLCTTPSLGLRS